MSIEFGLVDNSDCIFLLKYKSFKVTGVCAATNLNTEDKVRVNNCIINTSSFEGLCCNKIFRGPEEKHDLRYFASNTINLEFEVEKRVNKSFQKFACGHC